MLCKTIILSNSENLASNAPKGILTLSKENNLVNGKIRLYNLSSLPQSTKIGLYINETVHIATLNYKQQCYTFNLTDDIDITQSIYCALIDTSNNKKVLLEGGSFNGFYFTDSPFDAVLESKYDQLEQVIDTALKDEDITCNDCNCANCEYKKHFYNNYSHKNTNHSSKIDNPIDDYEYKPNNTDVSQTQNCKTYFNKPIQSKTIENAFDDSIQSNIIDKLKFDIINNAEEYCKQLENSFNNVSKNEFIQNKTIVDDQSKSLDNHEKQDTENNQIKQNQQQLDFLNDIIYQLDELLTHNPPDDTLNSIIPNSRFVKVESDNPYVLGVIYEDKMLKYIAYGVPATYNELPPKDLGQNYQWLPLNPRDVMSDGYFMIFQDALSGTLVEINFEE